MKKVLLLAAAVALTLVSCNKDEELLTADQITDTVEFRSLADKGTKAAITDINNLLSFTVTGIKMNNTTTDGYLFNGFGITRGEGNNWDYTPKRYWPADRTIDFYAYSPASSKNVTKGITEFDPTTKNSISYTVPTISETDAQEDFLVARITGRDKSTGAVSLNFHHALSRIKFYAKTTQKNVTYTVESVELMNLYTTGELDLTETGITETGPLAYSSELVLWKNQTDSKSYVVDMGESPIYLLNDYRSIFGKTGAILVLPQKTSISSKGTGKEAPGTTEFAIKVAYRAFDGDIDYAGKEGAPEIKYFAVKNLSDATKGITFEMGRQYNFYLEFGEDIDGEINFNVSVSNWNDVPDLFIPELKNYASLLSTDLAKIANSDFDVVGSPNYGVVTYSNLENVLYLGNGTPITGSFDFKGIEYFSKLQSISMKDITASGNLDLSKNTALTSVTITGTSTLGEVNLSNGALTALSLSGSITANIDASYNKLSTATIASGTIITGDLNISNNPLAIAMSLNNVKTGNLDMSNTGITKVDFTGAELGDVNLSNTAITALALPSGATIASLNASNNNNLTSVTFGAAMVDLDLSNNPKLNGAMSLTGAKATGSLNLSNTAITSVEIKGAELGDVNLKSLPSLEKIEFGGTNTITSLDASDNAINTVTFASGTNITGSLNLSKNIAIKTVDLTNVTITGSLDLSSCGLTSVTMKKNTITSLNLSGNKFTKLTLGDNTDNNTDDLSNFGDLNVSNNTALTELTVLGSVTGTLDATGNASLTTFKMVKRAYPDDMIATSGCTINKLDLSDSKSIAKIDVYLSTVTKLIVWDDCPIYHIDNIINVVNYNSYQGKVVGIYKKSDEGTPIGKKP